MISRSLDKARDAYKTKDIKATIAAHATIGGAGQEGHQYHGKYIKSVIYGGLDGTITTFAVVAGVAGASLSATIVIILGFANLIADGISMAAGDYLSTKSENEFHRAERKREEWEVDHHPQGEVKETIELFQEKGFTEKDATSLTNIIAKNKKAWVDYMMVEELGILESDENPLKNAIITLLSFISFGFIPLITYLLAPSIPFIAENSFLVASILTGLTLFVLGAMKYKITSTNWFRAGAEMFLVGGVAAAAAYFIGFMISSIV